MPVEAFVIFKVEYSTGKSITLKVFRLERTNLNHNYVMNDIPHRVVAYVAQNYNVVTVEEITNYIFDNIEGVLAVEGLYPDSTGFTIYAEHDS